jgi:uncharacterized protein YdaU (DUF1376 family)
MPKMNLWIDAFNSDTSFLSDEELGIYFRLIFFAWSREGYIPDDIDFIVSLTRNGNKEAIEKIIKLYWTKENDQYYQKRLREEYIRAVETTEINKLNGKKGGEANAKRIRSERLSESEASISISKSISKSIYNNNIYPLSEDEKDNNINKGNGVIKKQRTITNYSDDFEDLWKSLSIENRTRSNKPSSFKLYKALCKDDQELVRKNWKGYQSDQAKENGNFAKALERYIRAETFRISSNQEEKEYKEAW